MSPEDPAVSRRAVLAGTTGVASALAGCGAVGGSGSGSPVAVLAAGSLNLALTEGLRRAVDQPVRIESRGSVTVARMVAEGQSDPDVVAVADPSLFSSVLDAPWYATYANNAMVLAYNGETEGGQRVARADRWYEPLAAGEATLGRSDPDLDPLGYRTRFVLQLGAEYYGRDGLAVDVLRDDQIYPETELLSHFETGTLDAAMVYRSMAIERDFQFIELPDEIDMSAPEYVDNWYASVSYTLPDDRTVSGDVISYGAFVPDGHLDDNTRDVFETMVDGAYLQEYGFDVAPDYPTYTGHVPDEITT